ncbi:MAG TPA: EamA family transporter [Candidatus Dormibacteraeota bacterium]|nr:EamA family transporter [Candidatus Dormibacteraeota bacterium]
MSKVIFLLIVALIFEAVGVVYLSAGLKQIGEVKTLSLREVGRVIREGAVNGRILLGVLLETIFFGFLIVLLKRNDVSLIWPLTSLGFLLTALSARFILHEQVSPVRWVGVVLIVMGAALVSWSEKVKRPNPVRSEPATSSVPQP